MSNLNAPELNWILPIPILRRDLAKIQLPDEITAILARRGITNIKEINQFISPSDLPEAREHFTELEKVIERLIAASKSQEKVAVCGDYDADGMTSTVLLTECLERFNVNVVPSIPNRFTDGYGLNIETVKKLKKDGVKVIITVDNGVSAIEAIKLANNYQIDLIISDHHTIPKDLPKIYALIHPHKTPHDSPYKYLAGVGIAYLIALALSKEVDNPFLVENSLDYFCIGTIADMAPLKGANRYLLKKGLPRISYTKSIGLSTLIKTSGITYSKITAEDVGFKIAPRINAIGRLDDPYIVVNMLTENNETKAQEYATKCNQTNLNRKNLTNRSELEAVSIINDSSNGIPFFLVAYKADWHIGVIGLIASKLMNYYNRPVAVLAKANDDTLRGSARAPKQFDLIKTISQCSEILDSYGGHKAAAGFTIKYENITKLRTKLASLTKNLKVQDFIPRIEPEVLLNFTDINQDLIDSLNTLAPFGVDNPKPIFWSRKCKVVSLFKMKGDHVKLNLIQDEITIDAIHWNSEYDYLINSYIDICFHLEVNNWKGKEKLQLSIINTKESSDLISFSVKNRKYLTYFCNSSKEIIIKNELGKIVKSDSYKNEFAHQGISLKYLDQLFSIAKLSLGLKDEYI